MPLVRFVETRQIRRNHKTVQWRAGEIYEYDPEMEPMIKIGHAAIVEEAPAPPPAPLASPAREPASPSATKVKRSQEPT
jgi:hypothetical protein